MDEVHSERVLVVPTELFRRIGYFQGFCRDVDRYLGELLGPERVSFRPRAEVEQDPGYKQLIPYVIFRHRDGRGRETVFQYTRGSGQARGPPAPQTERGHRRAHFRRGRRGRRRKPLRRRHAPRN